MVTTTEEYRVIGTATFPFLEVDYLVPLVSKGQAYFTLGSYSYGMISKEDVDIAIQEGLIVQFEPSKDSTLETQEAEDPPSDDENFCLSYYVAYCHKKIKEDVPSICMEEYEGFRKLNSPAHLKDYLFYLAPVESLKTWLQDCFGIYKWHVEKKLQKTLKLLVDWNKYQVQVQPEDTLTNSILFQTLRKCYKPQREEDESLFENFARDLSILQSFATDNKQMAETLVLRFILSGLFEEKIEDNANDEWILAIASSWGFEYSVEEWKKQVMEKLKSITCPCPVPSANKQITHVATRFKDGNVHRISSANKQITHVATRYPKWTGSHSRWLEPVKDMRVAAEKVAKLKNHWLHVEQENSLFLPTAPIGTPVVINRGEFVQIECRIDSLQGTEPTCFPSESANTKSVQTTKKNEKILSSYVINVDSPPLNKYNRSRGIVYTSESSRG